MKAASGFYQREARFWHGEPALSPEFTPARNLFAASALENPAPSADLRPSIKEFK
jgi:hypothetical protein